MSSSVAGRAFPTATDLSEFVSHNADYGRDEIALFHHSALPEAAQPRDCGVHSPKASALGESWGEWLRRRPTRLICVGTLGRSAFC